MLFLCVASDAKKMNVSLGLLPCIFHLGERERREPALMNRSPPTLMLNRKKFVISGQHVFAICVSNYFLRE